MNVCMPAARASAIAQKSIFTLCTGLVKFELEDGFFVFLSVSGSDEAQFFVGVVRQSLVRPGVVRMLVQRAVQQQWSGCQAQCAVFEFRSSE